MLLFTNNKLEPMSVGQHKVHIPLHKNVIIVRLPSTSVECFC